MYLPIESDRLSFDELLFARDTVWCGRFEAEGADWRRFERQTTRPGLSGAPYGVPLWPIDFHCHGIGRFDFTDIPALALDEIDRQLAQQGTWCILTLYLPKENFEQFLELMRVFDAGRRRGRYPNILGLALEGPLLASHGGTPRIGVWSPTRDEWQRLAACGALGLQYIVLSPDANPGAEATEQPLPHRPPASVEWIVDLLLESGVRPALGHFRKTDPEASASALRAVLARGERSTRRGPAFVSDHVFNDMPLAFTHAWRSPEARLRRESELREARLHEWTMDNLEQRAGPVPAALLRGAHEGAVALCMNFDGEHVDLAVCKRVVELLGTDHLIGMTDRIQSARLAKQHLRQLPGGTLLYQSEGIVAAGTQSLDRQMGNMRSIGLSEAQIWDLVGFTPARVLGLEPELDGQGLPRVTSVVSGERTRRALASPGWQVATP